MSGHERRPGARRDGRVVRTVGSVVGGRQPCPQRTGATWAAHSPFWRRRRRARNYQIEDQGVRASPARREYRHRDADRVSPGRPHEGRRLSLRTRGQRSARSDRAELQVLDVISVSSVRLAPSGKTYDRSGAGSRSTRLSTGSTRTLASVSTSSSALWTTRWISTDELGGARWPPFRVVLPGRASGSCFAVRAHQARVGRDLPHRHVP
jgi:hypothetical protein